MQMGADAGVLLEKLLRIPDSEREFTVTPEGALADYQVPEELLDLLRANGLPAQPGADCWLYDLADMLNVALHLDIGSRHRKVLGWWIRALERPCGEVVHYRMDYLPGCPLPEHAGSCHYSLLDRDGRRIKVTCEPQSRKPLHSLSFQLSQRWPTLPAPLRRLVDEVADIRFVRLHEPLRWDTDFIRVSGIGDCCGVAKLMVEEALDRGIPARMSSGRALTPPFSTGHFWAEFLIAGQWVPLDPVLIDALIEWGVCAPTHWNRHNSLGGILARFGEYRQPLALHNGVEIEPRLAYRNSV
ncbi:transglutaminase domain-containing protein [Streptomyces silvisoli]|uniref:Transglutaminase domain-containing protein n=1 Tax=Streptomyces silvisoli TaxID=3034235 RepID=A0ABT5ZKF1_9ACTN|nr:transglutaminase domain-containing protein [Streptomyces silvisoli]MDF3290311.1 transglutaminase domain-containing protein [Streptomyces silvisoli]